MAKPNAGYGAAARRMPDLVQVAAGYGRPETLVTVSFLEAYGCTPVAPLHMASICWGKVVAFGGIRVMVPSAERDTVAALLGSLEPFQAPRSGLARLLHTLIFVGIFLLYGLPPPARGLIDMTAQPRATADTI